MTKIGHREVWLLAWPAIVQHLAHTALFLGDRAILGNYSEEALASMQIGGPVIWSTYSIFSAFVVGAVAVIGRKVGAKEEREAEGAMRFAVLVALGLGIAALIVGRLGLLGLDSLLPEVGEGVRDAAKAYLRPALAMMPQTLVALTIAASLQAAGDTRTPLVATLLANATNLALDVGLVFGVGPLPELGSEGAGIATFCAALVEALVLFGVVRWGKGARVRFRFRRSLARPLQHEILRISMPALGERCVQHAGFMIFVGMVTRLGDEAMAANQALLSVESIVFMSGEGFGIAAAALAAQSLGAGRPDLAQRSAELARNQAMVLLAAYGVVFVLFPEPLLRLFGSDPERIALALPCMFAAALSAPLLGAADALSSAHRGAGDTRSAFLITFFGGFVVRLSAVYLLAFELQLGLLGVWLGTTADWFARSSLLQLSLRRGRWKTKVLADAR